MDYSGVVFLGILVLGIASFWPARRGHWSGLVMALPCVLLGLAFAVAIMAEGFRIIYPVLLLFPPVYLGLGIASILLWYTRRSERQRLQRFRED